MARIGVEGRRVGVQLTRHEELASPGGGPSRSRTSGQGVGTLDDGMEWFA
jgi:hypothetical protein